jgi:hypothetical protein
LSCITGPEAESPDSYSDLACAQSISTYPHLPIHEKRYALPINIYGNAKSEGDPICDRYSLHIYENRIIATIADGCNWGVMPRDAAVNATIAFSGYLKQHLEEISDLKDVGPLLIKCMSIAHEAVRKFLEFSCKRVVDCCGKRIV